MSETAVVSHLDDCYYITPLEMIQNPTLGQVKGYVFSNRATHREIKIWLTKTGLHNLFKDLGIDWEGFFDLPNVRGSFMVKATPEQRDMIKAALDDMTMFRSYATIQQQNQRENAARYEAAQRASYADMMKKCAEIRKLYPDLAE